MSNTKRTRGTITFVLRKSTNEEKPISLNYSYGRGNRFVYAIGYSVLIKYWDDKKYRVKNVAVVRNSIEINDLIRDLESELERFVVECDSKQLQITNSVLKEQLDIYTNKFKIEDKKVERITLLKSIANHNIRKEKELPKPSKGKINQTVKSYKQTENHLKEFVNDTGYNLDFDSVDEEFYAEFVDYMSNKTYGNENYYHLNTIGKHIKNLKVFMKDAFYLDLHNNLKFERFKVLTEITTAIYLTQNELEKIFNLELKESHLSLARDIFIIGCEIGQRISDYHDLNKHAFKIVKGKKCIEVKQEKTNKIVICYLTSAIEKIMNDRYSGKFPPKISEQKLNDYIKIVGKKAGLIDEIKVEGTIGGKPSVKFVPKYSLIMGHTARRTFCTLKYQAGMNVHDIMELSAHSTEKEFFKYIRNSHEERVSRIINTEAYKNSSLII